MARVIWPFIYMNMNRQLSCYTVFTGKFQTSPSAMTYPYVPGIRHHSSVTILGVYHVNNDSSCIGNTLAVSNAEAFIWIAHECDWKPIRDHLWGG